MTLYNTVLKILTEKPETRDSDKKLIWAVWYELDFITTNYYEDGDYESDITFSNFMEAPSTESIRRCRQAIQACEIHKDLRASEGVRKNRKRLEKEYTGLLF